jgi:hypothetical protein
MGIPFSAKIEFAFCVISECTKGRFTIATSRKKSSASETNTYLIILKATFNFGVTLLFFN